MNFGVEADIIRALGKITANGHLVKGYKPVYWSVVGGSALAEAEVEYQDKTSFSIDVRLSGDWTPSSWISCLLPLVGCLVRVKLMF